MSDLGDVDLAGVTTQQFAQIVKDTPDDKITEALTGEHRAKILDAIFAKFPQLFRADKAGSTNAIIHWSVTGGPAGGVDTYEVVVADGACTVNGVPEHEPKLALTASPLDFIKVISGNGNPVMLFMTGKLKAKGDLGLAANIAHLFDIPKA